MKTETICRDHCIILFLYFGESMTIIKCYVLNYIFTITTSQKFPGQKSSLVKDIYPKIDYSKAYIITGRKKSFAQLLKSNLPKVDIFFYSEHNNKYFSPPDKNISNDWVHLNIPTLYNSSEFSKNNSQFIGIKTLHTHKL